MNRLSILPPRRLLATAAVLLTVIPLYAATTVQSPNGRIVATLDLTAGGEPSFHVVHDGNTVVRPSPLGLVGDGADFSSGLQSAGEPQVTPLRDSYEILTSKRRHNVYTANRLVMPLQKDGRRMDIIVQVSNDGVALRYVFPEADDSVLHIVDEKTAFVLPEGTRAWLQPMAVAKTGWNGTNPSYEEHYLMDVPAGTASPLSAGWVYPALFHTGDTWIAISESDLGPDYCGTRLVDAWDEHGNHRYKVGFPDPRERIGDGPVNPESKTPWKSPWRVLCIGTLKTLVESTLGTDLARPQLVQPGVEPRPGHASWSWPLMGDANTTFDVQKQFIDYAADMHWDYCLIDAAWDVMIGYEKVGELIDYARERNIGILLWYNSAGAWNSTPYTPRDKLLTHESRITEFERLEAMGVAGLKIDFFGGDGQSNIAYYHDILRDSAPYGFLINFHGATIPRGWNRTYPHLMTMEAIKGLEFVTFAQSNADLEAAHAAVIPFTRGLWDPMDFTPMVLDRINLIERRTSSVFELALPVIFTSGITHFAEIPGGMAKAPEYVRDFLRELPRVWDDVRFIDGYPGRYCVLARKGGERWIIAGINAGDIPRQVTIDLSALPVAGPGTIIRDGGGGNLSFETAEVDNTQPLETTIPPCGGFVASFPAR